MPFLDSRMCSEPSGLKELSLMNCTGGSNGHSSSRSSIVGSVDKGFSKLTLTLIPGLVLRIVGMRFHEFGNVGCGEILQGNPIKDMEVNSHPKCGFEVVIISFPYNNLKVDAIKVGIADSAAGIGNEELTDVWQSLVGKEFHRRSSRNATQARRPAST
jgi:hypothetical protein